MIRESDDGGLHDPALAAVSGDGYNLCGPDPDRADRTCDGLDLPYPLETGGAVAGAPDGQVIDVAGVMGWNRS